MDKMKLIEELKRKKETEKTDKVKVENVEETPIESESGTSENISISKKRRSRRRNKKNKPLTLVGGTSVDNMQNVELSEYETESFKKFKKEFLEDEDKAEFIDFIEYHKGQGDKVFEPDFFILKKMQEERVKTIIIDPSVDDMSRGVGSSFYLVKPMYNHEYVKFIKDYGPREEFPEEFMTRMFQTSLIYPENLTEQDIRKLPTGTVLSIYRVILDLSDFNKTYRIIEV